MYHHMLVLLLPFSEKFTPTPTGRTSRVRFGASRATIVVQARLLTFITLARRRISGQHCLETRSNKALLSIQFDEGHRWANNFSGASPRSIMLLHISKAHFLPHFSRQVPCGDSLAECCVERPSEDIGVVAASTEYDAVEHKLSMKPTVER